MMGHRQWIIITAISATLFQTFPTAKSAPEADKIIRLPGQPEVSFQQYSGYITIDEQQQRNIFYYFVEAETDPASKPLVLWTTGGPGCSSLGAGAFFEHGPFRPSGDILVKNEYSWNKEANMLYLESPVGVGFSYSTNESFYKYLNDEITARDNLAFLENWFTKFSEHKNRDFFITGESYAENRKLCFLPSHYVPQLAELIVKTGAKFNLKGIALGNPALDYDTDANSGPEYLWSHGLLSDSTYESLTKVCNYSQILRQNLSGSVTPVCAEVRRQYQSERSSFIDRHEILLDVCLSSVVSESQKLNELQDTENVDVCVKEKTRDYLNRKDVQEALHARLVGITNWTHCSSIITYDRLDNLNSTIQILGTLAKSGVRVFVFSGDQDSVIPLTGTRTLIDGLAKELGLNTTVPYRAWFHGRQVAGFTRFYDEILSFSTVRGGGHQPAWTQPARSLVMFRGFLAGKPLPEA